MNLTITPAKLSGSVAAIPSKSQAHRLLLCAAFADRETRLLCPDTNKDIEATAACLRALGAGILRTETGYTVAPIRSLPRQAELPCGESGSTLRFLLPIAGALGVDALFRMEGRLPKRPLSPLWEELEAHGCRLTRPTADTLRCEGRLQSGSYRIRGDISSQFITGLLYALTLTGGESRLEVTGQMESAPYIRMTLDAMKVFGVTPAQEAQIFTVGAQCYRSPGFLPVEGDWSNGAFWLAAKALGSQLEVTGLDPDSAQGDRAVVEFLERLEDNCRIDAAQTPDLVPVLAVVAGGKKGAVFTNCSRLRLKETDRLMTTAAMLRALGGAAEIVDDELHVTGTGYTGGTVDATNDHRIAMAAAVAATVATGAVTVIDASAVEKSYPGFWNDYKHLGGTL